MMKACLAGFLFYMLIIVFIIHSIDNYSYLAFKIIYRF